MNIDSIRTDEFQFSDVINNMDQEGGAKRDSAKCGSGMTLRKAYDRKGYTKKSYIKSDGTIVPSVRIPAAHVAESCVPSKGEGKPAILPRPSGKLHLSKYGYATKRSSDEREKSLRDAIADGANPLEVLKHLNLIANYMSWNPKAQKKLRKDVKYMSKLYKGWKKSNSKGGSEKKN